MTYEIYVINQLVVEFKETLISLLNCMKNLGVLCR